VSDQLSGATRASAVVTGWLVSLLVAGGIAFCPPATASPARSTQRPTVVVVSGFRPLRNGYAFPNYGAEPGVPNLGSDEMRQLFGNGVCAGFVGGLCVLSPPALAWMQQENAAMADGHCVGFSVTALFFYSRLSNPQQFGAPAVPGLKITSNQLLAREIAYGYVFQVLDSVRRAEISGSPREVLSRLTSALRTSSELYTLGITEPDGTGGHAVTPYEIERLRPNHYAILVYDNNYPRTTRTVLVNTKTDTWSFKAAPTPNQPGSLYTGDATTHSLFLLPTRPGLGVQPCPFCSTNTPAPAAAGTASAGRRAASYETIRLQTAGPVAGHLVITGAHGRRVGFVHGRLLDQIPGARIISLFVGGTRTWLDHVEPEYELPTGQAYRIELSGRATAAARPGPAVSSQVSVTVLEPGFLASVQRITLHSGQRDLIELPADGHTIAFLPWGGVEQAFGLVLGNAAAGANDHEWQINDLGAPSGEWISASLDLAGQSMSINGAGSYDLSMDQVGNGVSVFGHDDVGVAAGVTAKLAYGHWTAGSTMPLTDTKDGIVVGQQALSDQPNPADTGSEFEPTESTPAPAEPQPHPEPPSATATTLVCSPGTVVIGGAAKCVVDVSDLDSNVAATPIGAVAFSSDAGGSFSTHSCTLSRGSCQVRYTPTATGSGTHRLTASYDGASPYHRSAATISLQVTNIVPAVTALPTHTSLTCRPQELPVDAPTTCTATVTDTGVAAPNAPTGEVDFSSDGSGSFSAASCMLADGACEVAYTPSAVGSGSHDLTASYHGDQTQQMSEATATVEVRLRSVTASLDCEPPEVQVGSPTTCTATVTDTDAGTRSPPLGTVTFASDRGGDFDGNPCALSAVSEASSSCSVTFTPTSQWAGVTYISATYSGDSTHAGDAGPTCTRCCHSATAKRRVMIDPRTSAR
jgi:hypothetical protein